MMKKELLAKICLSLIWAVLFVSCGKSYRSDVFVDDNGNEQQIEIIRFDSILFSKPNESLETFLRSTAKAYPEMFQMSLDDKEQMAMVERFVTDEGMIDVHSLVQQKYPDLRFLEKDLTGAFSRLKKIYPKTILPKRVFAMILGPSDFSYMYANRTYTNGDYFVIALDMYSMPDVKKNPYYQSVPEYMTYTLNRNYIATDFMNMYLKNIACTFVKDVTMNPDCTFLDCIIDEGRFLYFVKQLLPDYTDAQVLNLSDSGYVWCQNNEKLIWGYIIQNSLLYEKDRSKYMSMIALGPSSKPLNNSPSRVGYYIGYKIVNEFMDKENISIDSLMKITSSEQILRLSKYKPKR